MVDLDFEARIGVEGGSGGVGCTRVVAAGSDLTSGFEKEVELDRSGLASCSAFVAKPVRFG